MARAAAVASPRGGTLAAMSIPQYPRLWLVGMLLHLSRWMTIFLGSYLVNQLTESAFLVQLVGAALFAPMFVGGAVAGAIADRLDRKRTILAILAVLIPFCLLMTALQMSGGLEVWMAYPFALAVGTVLLSDMTVRRAMVYDVVGPANLNNAIALEALAMQGGAMAGGAGAGAVISLFGIGEVFLVIAGVYVVAIVALAGVQLPPRTAKPESTRLLGDIIHGFRALPRHPALVSVLGVTVIVNLFYFSFLPLVPVFGERLEVGAFLTSLLLSAVSLGSILGALVLARGLPVGRGTIYVGGSTVALCGLFVFAVAGWYPVALLALIAAGMGVAGFATMQSVLVMVNADDDMRGRSMGLLSMSIGVLPISMLGLGLAASVVGPTAGVVISVIVGLLVLGAWTLKRPEAWTAA